MGIFIKIAWRNIARNRSRSTLTIAAIAVGLCALIFLKAFIDGADNQMLANYTDLLTGHIQIHRQGFQKTMGLDKTIGEPEIIADLLHRTPTVIAYSPRVKNFVLASSAEGSAGVLLLGIDPVGEKYVSTLDHHLYTGRFFTATDTDKIIIGRKLAESLNVGLAGKVVLMAQAADGSTAASAYEVIGILEAGSDEIDKGLALITLPAAQELLVMGHRVSEIVVKTSALDTIDTIAELLKKNIDTRKYEVLTWKDISPMIYQWLQFDQVFSGLILFIVLLVVGSALLNTMLMCVVERTREFGNMLALGVKADRIAFMVTAESFGLGLIGTFLGLAGGVGLVLIFSSIGINLSAVSRALNNFYIGSVVYPVFDPIGIAVYAIIILAVSVAVATVSAYRVRRLTPIEAMKNL